MLKPGFLLLFLIFLYYKVVSKMFFTLIGCMLIIYYLIYCVCMLVFDCDVALGFAEIFGKKINSLKGKVVFITGASSGIGEHTAIALAKHGVKLVLAARRREELERVKGICLEKANGLLNDSDILILPMDVLKLNLHQAYFDEALRHFGHVDILLSNAGRSQRAYWENIDMEVDKQMFDINVFGVISLTRIAVKYFQSRDDGGHVAVTSSLAGIIGIPFSGTYCGTKHAIHGYFNSLRTEKAAGKLTVSVLCPGPILTNFLAHSFTETVDQTYGISASATDRRMTGERCGQLCAIALANKLNESWMALLPVIPLTYIAVYSPIIYNLALRIMGPQTLQKLRDSKKLEAPSSVNVN